MDYLLYGIVDNLTQDRAQLKFLVLLRNTCKRLKEHIPRVYMLRCRLDKLQSEVFNWLQKLSITLAYRLPFHNTWQRRHFEFYVQCGWRKVLLWAVHTRYETLRIVDCPWKAPYECFELDITPAHDEKIASLSHISKRGPPSVEKNEACFDKLEAILTKYKGTLSAQLIKIQEEFNPGEASDDYDSPHDDYEHASGESEHGDQLVELVDESSQEAYNSEVINLVDPDVMNQGGLIAEVIVVN